MENNRTSSNNKNLYPKSLFPTEEDYFIREYHGYSKCRLCGCRNGCKEFIIDEFMWPEGFRHYIQAHNVRPTQEFIDFILKEKFYD